MTLAVYTPFAPQKQEATTSFFIHCFAQLSIQYPQHQFIFFTKNPLDKNIFPNKNSSVISIAANTQNPLQLWFWANFMLPALLKKYKANVLINLSAHNVRTALPKCAVVDTMGKLSALKKGVQKANTIIATSQFLKQQITASTKIFDNKIDVVYCLPNKNFKKLSDPEKEKIKQIYTQGKEYFFYNNASTSAENFVLLLKAFSVFKKRQKSNMQLVIAVPKKNKAPHIFESLSTYKFKEDVKLVHEVEDLVLAKITASAYAIINLSNYQSHYHTLLQAMQCKVPLITTDTAIAKEICADSVIFTTNDMADIANKMMLLFKDEAKCQQIILSQWQRLNLYSQNKMIEAVWNSVVKCSTNFFSIPHI